MHRQVINSAVESPATEQELAAAKVAAEAEFLRLWEALVLQQQAPHQADNRARDRNPRAGPRSCGP